MIYEVRVLEKVFKCGTKPNWVGLCEISNFISALTKLAFERNGFEKIIGAGRNLKGIFGHFKSCIFFLES